MSEKFVQKEIKDNGFLKESGTLSKNQSFSFAMIADSHIDSNVPQRSKDLTAIYQHLMQHPNRQPDFLIHAGDMVECGLPHEYEEFTRLIPPSFRDRIYVIPGNHEVRWDQWTGERYRELFGASQYSFDKGGVHFIALNPTDFLIEAGHFTKEDLEWLKEDLRKLQAETPVIIYLHYPIGGNNYFISNEDTLFEALEGYNVRAVFSGHVHREDKWEQNGLTLFSLPAVKNGPFFFWLEKSDDGNGIPILFVHSGELQGAEREPTLRLIAEVSLKGKKPAGFEKPDDIGFSLHGSNTAIASLYVRFNSHSKVKSVYYQFWPEYTWAGKDNGNWRALNSQDAGEFPLDWRAEINLTGMPEGKYRLQVRVVNDLNQKWDEFLEVAIPEEKKRGRLKWAADLGAPIQVGLALASGYDDTPPLVIAATTNGKVSAATLDGNLVWTFHASDSVLSSPQFDKESNHVIFGANDHRVYALNASNGKKTWSYNDKQAVLGTPVIDHAQVIVSAGRQLSSLSIEDGKCNWVTKIGGFTGGMPAVDENAVYCGAGDGCIYALDKSTGSIRWKTSLGSKETPFRTLIYSAWGTKAAVIPKKKGIPPILLVSNVSMAYGLNRYTGKIIWEYSVSNPYSAPLFYTSGDETKAVLVDDWGNVTLLDPYSGKIMWRVTASQRIINTSPVTSGNLVYVTGVNGLLMGLDLSNGQIVDQYHFSTQCVYSTPVISDSLLIQGGQDGILRGIELKQ